MGLVRRLIDKLSLGGLPTPPPPPRVPTQRDIMFEVVLALLDHPKDWTEKKHTLDHKSGIMLWVNPGIPGSYRFYDQDNYPNPGPCEGLHEGDPGDVWWTETQIAAIDAKVAKMRRDKRLMEGKPLDRQEKAIWLLKDWRAKNPEHPTSEMIEVL
jgi:hypothetical protein